MCALQVKQAMRARGKQPDPNLQQAEAQQPEQPAEVKTKGKGRGRGRAKKAQKPTGDVVPLPEPKASPNQKAPKAKKRTPKVAADDDVGLQKCWELQDWGFLTPDLYLDKCLSHNVALAH